MASFLVLSLLASLEDTLIGSAFSEGQLITILNAVECHLDFDDLYNLFVNPAIGAMGREQLLPALRQRRFIQIHGDMRLEDLTTIFGHQGAQGLDPEYTFVLHQDTTIKDFSDLYVSRIEVIDRSCAHYTFNTSLITRVKLNASGLFSADAKFLIQCPNLRHLSLLHGGFNLVHSPTLNLNLTYFSVQCMIISESQVVFFNNMNALVEIVYFSRRSLTELVLRRNYCASWRYEDYYVNYISAMIHIEQFPCLEYLVLDVSPQMPALAFLPQFLEKYPVLRVVKFYVYVPMLRPIEFICNSVLNKASVTKFVLLISQDPSPVTSEFLDNLIRSDPRFALSRDPRCEKCYEMERAWWGH